MIVKTGNMKLAELAGSFKIPVIYDQDDLESSFELDALDVEKLTALWSSPKAKLILNTLGKML